MAVSHTFIPTTTQEAVRVGEPWLLELRQQLDSAYFPATRDDLLALMLRRHAPARLLGLLGCLPWQQAFDSAEQVASYVAGHLRDTGALYQPREPA
jgi:hypothetical protein